MSEQQRPHLVAARDAFARAQLALPASATFDERVNAGLAAVLGQMGLPNAPRQADDLWNDKSFVRAARVVLQELKNHEAFTPIRRPNDGMPAHLATGAA